MASPTILGILSACHTYSCLRALSYRSRISYLPLLLIETCSLSTRHTALLLGPGMSGTHILCTCKSYQVKCYRPLVRRANRRVVRKKGTRAGRSNLQPWEVAFHPHLSMAHGQWHVWYTTASCRVTVCAGMYDTGTSVPCHWSDMYMMSCSVLCCCITPE